MDTGLLQDKFARMGARLRIGQPGRPNRWRNDLPFALDVQTDARGEFFLINFRPEEDLDLKVLDVRRRERHLLLMARLNGVKHLYLCGHDERHWFVAGVPERRGGVPTVDRAIEALKPPEVLTAQARQSLNGRARRRRKNAAFRRQGEWFFLPAPHLKVDKELVLHDEPLSRGNGGKPHWAEYCYRVGGDTVYVCDVFPAGLRPAEYRRLIANNPKMKTWNWRQMRRNPEAYVKGHIRHPDHATIRLDVWHRVLMNTEGEAQGAMRNVVFLD
jgi:hypothetical protein